MSDTFVSPRIRQHVVPYDETVVRVPVISDSVAESILEISSRIEKKRKKENEWNGKKEKGVDRIGISWKRLERGHERFGYGTNSTLAHPPFLSFSTTTLYFIDR